MQSSSQLAEQQKGSWLHTAPVQAEQVEPSAAPLEQ
jgi:hypothetical protein